MKIAFAISLFWVLLSCKTEIKKPIEPENIVSRNVMISITKELMLLESHISISYGDVAVFYKIINASSDSIFRKYKIPRYRYIKTFEYYSTNPDKMTQLYLDVLDRLNVEKNSI